MSKQTPYSELFSISKGLNQKPQKLGSQYLIAQIEETKQKITQLQSSGDKVPPEYLGPVLSGFLGRLQAQEASLSKVLAKELPGKKLEKQEFARQNTLVEDLLLKKITNEDYIRSVEQNIVHKLFPQGNSYQALSPNKKAEFDDLNKRRKNQEITPQKIESFVNKYRVRIREQMQRHLVGAFQDYRYALKIPADHFTPQNAPYHVADYLQQFEYILYALLTRKGYRNIRGFTVNDQGEVKPGTFGQYFSPSFEEMRAKVEHNIIARSQRTAQLYLDNPERKEENLRRINQAKKLREPEIKQKQQQALQKAREVQDPKIKELRSKIKQVARNAYVDYALHHEISKPVEASPEQLLAAELSDIQNQALSRPIRYAEYAAKKRAKLVPAPEVLSGLIVIDEDRKKQLKDRFQNQSLETQSHQYRLRQKGEGAETKVFWEQIVPQLFADSKYLAAFRSPKFSLSDTKGSDLIFMVRNRYSNAKLNLLEAYILTKFLACLQSPKILERLSPVYKQIVLGPEDTNVLRPLTADNVLLNPTHRLEVASVEELSLSQIHALLRDLPNYFTFKSVDVKTSDYQFQKKNRGFADYVFRRYDRDGIGDNQATLRDLRESLERDEDEK